MRLEDPSPIPMPYITTDDQTTLYYRDWGSGRPLMLLHSIGLSGAVWEGPMTSFVDGGRRCVALDRRGHGRSDDPGHGYDFDTLADDVAALIERLDLRDVTLIGHSLGAGEAVRYLARHDAGRVRRLVLAGTFTPSLLRSSDNPEGFDASFWDDTINSLVRGRAEVTAALLRTVFGADAPVDRLHWAAGLAAQTSLLAIVACLRAQQATDFTADLRSVTVPTLLLHGDADDLNPLSVTAVRTARAIPQSRLEVYAGAPHALFTSEPDRFVADVLSFDA